MSAATAPDPDDRIDRTHDDAGQAILSDRDRRILDDIAGHENGSDPAFVARLGITDSGRRTNPVLDRVIQVAVVLGLAALFVPTTWLLVGLLVVIFLGGPALLCWYDHRLRQQTARSRDGRDDAGDADDTA